LQRAQSAFERAGNTYDLGLTLNNSGMLYFDIGEYEQALQVYERGLRLVRGSGNATFEASILAGIAETYRSMGRFEESAATYAEARPVVEAVQMPFLMAHITDGLALTKLYLGNVLAVLFTAGLLIPWAVIRTRRYRLACLAIIVGEEIVHQASGRLPRVGATGQEMGDLFNVDLGI